MVVLTQQQIEALRYAGFKYDGHVTNGSMAEIEKVVIQIVEELKGVE